MTKPHKNIDTKYFELQAKKTIKNSDIPNLKFKVFKIVFDMLTYLMFEENPTKAFKDYKEEYKVFDELELIAGIDINIYELTIITYKEIVRKDNLGNLDIFDFSLEYTAINKESFIEESNFNMFKKANIAFSDDMLLFLQEIDINEELQISKISSISQVVKVANIHDYIMPDLTYKIATNSLNIKSKLEIDSTKKQIVIVQDSTFSMKRFEDKLIGIKALILDRCAAKQIKVTWIYASEDIIDIEIYDKLFIPNKKLIFKGISFNLSTILNKDMFLSKKTVIISDGTDALETIFNPKTSDIHLLLFNENLTITNKIKNYGKIFKI
jgi:hypothetical protein